MVESLIALSFSRGSGKDLDSDGKTLQISNGGRLFHVRYTDFDQKRCKIHESVHQKSPGRVVFPALEQAPGIIRTNIYEANDVYGGPSGQRLSRSAARAGMAADRFQASLSPALGLARGFGVAPFEGGAEASRGGPFAPG